MSKIVKKNKNNRCIFDILLTLNFVALIVKPVKEASCRTEVPETSLQLKSSLPARPANLTIVPERQCLPDKKVYSEYKTHTVNVRKDPDQSLGKSIT